MSKVIEDNRQDFYLRHGDLFDEGVLRELHAGEKYTLYAIAEETFGVVSFTDILPDGSFIILFMNDAEAREFVKDENFFIKTFEYRKSRNQIPILNEKTKEIFRRRNLKRLEAGKGNIPPEIEAEILGAKGLVK